MKKIVYFASMCLLFASCGGSNDSAPEPVNTAPSVPTLVAPTNNLLCISNTVVFEWTAAVDAENNPIVYQVQIATDNQFTQIVNTVENTARTQTLTFDRGKAYYWRVKATDSKNASSDYSISSSFYTEGTGLVNHLPFLPQIIQPEINSTVSGTVASLKWSATDVDTTDKLSYDVYLGTTNPPTTKVVDNKSSTSFEAQSLQPKATYYWKVVVKDDKGGETTGQVWNFKTN